ncbi:unnamed protein product [Rhizophagus irregularis]|nr:unnamed protein product [Rhizophagus irregularis]
MMILLWCYFITKSKYNLFCFITLGGNDGKEALDLDVVYLYDTINNIWNTNKVTGLIPSKRYLFSTVLDTINLEWYVPNITGQLPANRYNHKANVIGNFMVVSFGYGYQQEKESDILLLNMTNEKYEWTIVFKPLNDTLPLPSTSISPPPTMTQTSSPTISSEPQSNISSTTIKPIIIAGVLVGILFIILGGNDGKEALDLDVVYLYDTINNIWNTNKVTGLIPSKRYLFSTVLDTINLEWYVPNITGQLPANRYNHKANVIGNFMVVSFGYGYQQEKESDILLLNMTNEKYEWTIVFKPLNDTLPLPSTSISPPPTMTQTSSPTISSEPQSNISSTTIKPIIIAGVLVGILFIILGYLFL